MWPTLAFTKTIQKEVVEKDFQNLFLTDDVMIASHKTYKNMTQFDLGVHDQNIDLTRHLTFYLV